MGVGGGGARRGAAVAGTEFRCTEVAAALAE